MNNDLYIKVGGAGSADNDNWQRPSDWLPIPNIATGEQVVYALFAVYDVVGNYVSFSIQGNYTVDWGDGVTENFTSDSLASHQYSWSSVGSETSEGWRQALIKITPQIGQNIVQINFQRAHPSLSNGRVSQIVDLVINAVNVSSANLTIGGATVIFHRNLKRVWIKELGAITSAAFLFANCNSLQSVHLFNTSSVTNMTNMFNNCNSLKTVPLFNTSSVTNMASMFINCYSIESVPLFNTSSVTNMSSMFLACRVLQSIPLFVTSTLTNSTSMFNVCQSLVSVSINGIALTTTTTMFTSCTSMQKIVLSGLSRGVSLLNCQLSATALNDFFTSLGTASGSQTIIVTGNPGASTCDTTIATSKGFTVVI